MWNLAKNINNSVGEIKFYGLIMFKVSRINMPGAVGQRMQTSSVMSDAWDTGRENRSVP